MVHLPSENFQMERISICDKIPFGCDPLVAVGGFLGGEQGINDIQ